MLRVFYLGPVVLVTKHSAHLGCVRTRDGARLVSAEHCSSSTGMQGVCICVGMHERRGVCESVLFLASPCDAATTVTPAAFSFYCSHGEKGILYLGD